MKPFLLIAALWAGMASAGTATASETVLGCTAKGGAKEIAVVIDGDTISYSFGPAGGAPDLQLSEPVATVLHQPWSGVGRAIWEATTFTNAGYAYEVWMSVERQEDAVPSGGVAVLQGEAEVARIDCDPGSARVTLWAVSDAKEAQGICWDLQTFSWGSCPQ